MKLPFIRSPYNYDRDAVSDETGLKCEDATLTQQHQAEEADINNIIARFVRTGEMPSVSTRVPLNEDVSEYGTYHEVLSAMKSAQARFYELPEAIRARFGDNPEELMQFLDEDENREEAEKLGLVVRKEAAASEPPVSAAPAAKPEKAAAPSP